MIKFLYVIVGEVEVHGWHMEAKSFSVAVMLGQTSRRCHLLRCIPNQVMQTPILRLFAIILSVVHDLKNTPSIDTKANLSHRSHPIQISKFARGASMSHAVDKEDYHVISVYLSNILCVSIS